MTLGSLFDGLGGWQLAATRAGIKPVWSSEIDKFCLSVTARHFPETIQLGDINAISDAPHVDIITAGSPCQNLSVAGNRSGLNGNQSGLFFKAVELVRRLHPQFFVWENVLGAFSSNGGNDFRTVLEEIVEEHIPLPKHWSNAGMVDGRHVQVCWRILDAQYWGVPQRRRRIFLVADFAGRRAAEILFEQQSMRGNFAAGTGEERQTADRAGSRADSSSYCIQGNTIDRQLKNGANGKGILRDTSYTLNTIDRHAVYDMTHADEVLRPVTGDKSNCLNSRMGTGGNQVPLVGTLSARDYKSVPPTIDGKLINQQSALRRLTPLECERLQGLPDNWTVGGSDSARYRAIGNGMAQPCADWIMRQIKRHADC